MIPSGGTEPSMSLLVSPSPSAESTIGVGEKGSSPPSHDGGGGGAGPYFIRSWATSDLYGMTMTEYNMAPKNQTATTTSAITHRSYAQEGDNGWCIGGALSQRNAPPTTTLTDQMALPAYMVLAGTMPT